MALKNFDAEGLLQKWSEERFSPIHSGKTLAQCIREAFNIPSSDGYVYRAQAETTLDVTQQAIAGKRAHGLHGWYHDEERKPVGYTFFLFIHHVLSMVCLQGISVALVKVNCTDRH